MGSKIQKSGKCHELPRKSIFFFSPHPTLWLGVLGLKISKTLGYFMNCLENGVSKCQMILVTSVIFSVMLLQVTVVPKCEVCLQIFTSDVSIIK